MNRILMMLLLFAALFPSSIGVNAGNHKNHPVKELYVQQWRMIEVELVSEKQYAQPFRDVKVDAEFTGPNGELIKRPVFWDGGKTWRVRFSPTATGQWKMVTNASGKNDKGLHAVKKSITCVPYNGTLDIYKHGFLTVSADKRFFTYADGTPFFYLGDTHWLFIHEKFNSSNIEGISSQFKYIVDKRVEQQFTVYQSEAIQHPHGTNTSSVPSAKLNAGMEGVYADLTNGFDETDLAGFKNIDQKFAYVADKGLVHANSAICWALDPEKYPEIFTDEYMYQLGRYWAARYGAYPVLWTIAQEIDKNMYNHFDSVTIGKWYSAAAAIAANDPYNQPLTAHMENTSFTVASQSWWAHKPYHKWWSIQWQAGINDDITGIAKDFWFYTPAKPSVLYESAYEGFWTDDKGARSAGYKAFQNGIYGYGYGANGVWNHLYSQFPPDYGTGYEMPGRYLHWYDGANLPGADQLTLLKKFYTALQWWKLTPRFDDDAWASFTDKKQCALASDGQETFVVYFYNTVPATGVLKKLLKGNTYQAQWFNTRTGVYSFIGNINSTDGTWTIPMKPDSNDWILLVQKLDRQ